MLVGSGGLTAKNTSSLEDEKYFMQELHDFYSCYTRNVWRSSINGLHPYQYLQHIILRGGSAETSAASTLRAEPFIRCGLQKQVPMG